jgi:hypothetical protein
MDVTVKGVTAMAGLDAAGRRLGASIRGNIALVCAQPFSDF